MKSIHFNRTLIRYVLCFLLFVPLLSCCSCKPKSAPPPKPGNGANGAGSTQTTPSPGGENGFPETPPTPLPEVENERSMVLTSAAFGQGEPIPEEFTGDGLNLSPPLGWENVPEETREFALVCTDSDTPTAPWVHWVIYKIPATVTGLPAGVPQDLTLGAPLHAVQGRNSWTTGRVFGYRGPDPPRGHGTHHYHFTLYALDSKLEIEPGADIDALLEEMHGKILASAELVGTYIKE